MLQEGGSPQTEQQMSEMIKENLTLSVKKGKNHFPHLRCFILLSLGLRLIKAPFRNQIMDSRHRTIYID